MAWRIDEAVVRGEIDNTLEGRTTGRIWLLGREQPLELLLEGDCWRDLAGSRLVFENPEPIDQPDAHELDSRQEGVVGDMTASRKNKVPLMDEEEHLPLHEHRRQIPYEWKNTLYLEWFSETNGRVLIESADYRLEVSPHVWVMDEDAEQAQKLANLQAMRDFMALVIQRRDPDGTDPKPVGDLDEFAWEERLKESDRLTDAYQEVLEKYIHDADSESKEAFVMGWDGLLDALADQHEAEAGAAVDDDAEFDDDGFQDLDDGDDDLGDEPEENWDDEDGISHPLQASARELAMRAMDVVPGDTGPGSPAYELISCLLQVSGKLAAALNERGSGYEPETGYVLAILKRCLNWLNEAVSHCQQLMTTETDPDHLAALARIRSSAYEIRDGITELRRELK